MKCRGCSACCGLRVLIREILIAIFKIACTDSLLKVGNIYDIEAENLGLDPKFPHRQLRIIRARIAGCMDIPNRATDFCFLMKHAQPTTQSTCNLISTTRTSTTCLLDVVSEANMTRAEQQHPSQSASACLYCLRHEPMNVQTEPPPKESDRQTEPPPKE
jgi:hypothetical protein